ncbi:MAG TPA: DNA starvation/stationary phase protection protein [Roseiflexaceae bacterium]|nr:DNA starvation/stationary phase protection protein [Roseiflexaceae bacterium]
MATKQKTTVNTIDIGLTDEQRAGVAEILDRTLSDLYVLYTKTRNYHWNVVGEHFRDLHKLLEEQYEQLEEAIDLVAERSRKLGAPALGTLAEFLDHATLKEQPGDYPDSYTMLSNLCGDHEAVIQWLRQAADDCDEKYHDMGTNDFLIGLMQDHEKMAWMLRSYLEERR